MLVVSDNTILLLNLNILTVNTVTQSCHYMVHNHACAPPQVPQCANEFFMQHTLVSLIQHAPVLFVLSVLLLIFNFF